MLNVTNAPPVKPNKPLQELNAAMSDKLWLSSNPIDAVASNANLDLHLFKLNSFFIGILYPILVSTGQANTQS